ncbi:MAG: hypothetical protein AAES65_22590 [Candidatus Thiodiazotropha sp. (ex. Lucinoma kazani)]
MADETTNSEDNVKNKSAAETTAVKKKVAKKKVTKKKAAAKKKVTTKKKVVAKKKASPKKAVTNTDTAKAPQGETKPVASDTLKAESKAATPTAVAAASALASKPKPAESKPVSTSGQTNSSNVSIYTEIKKDNTPEESSMSTDSKSSSGFWVKIIFWLVIIVLAFMYIRSLAKNPLTESATNTTGVQHEEMTASGDSSSAAGGASVDEHAVTTSTTVESAVKSTEAEQNSGFVSGSSVSPASTAAPIATRSGSASSDSQETSSAASQTTASSSVDQDQTVTSQKSESTDASAAASQNKDVPQSIRDLHAESVSKILKEFDDLRDAAKAEMEAMRNLMQAERELQEAMAAPPVPVNPPAWRGRGPAYSPYGAYPQSQGYSPYNRR